MKKTMLLLAAMMVGLMGLTACGDDDNDEPAQDKTLTTTYEVKVSQDLLDVANVVMRYKGNNGENKFEAITSPQEWKKTVTTKKYPAPVGVLFEVSEKDTYSSTKDAYDLYIEVEIDCENYRGSHESKQTFGSKTTPVNNADVPKACKNNFNNKVFGFVYAEDGSASGSISF